MDSFKQALTRKVEDKKKENEELQKIENEQRAVTQVRTLKQRKEQALKILGPELFEKIYIYLKKALTANINPVSLQKELMAIVNNDKQKMDAVFNIEQIIYHEAIHKAHHFHSFYFILPTQRN